MCIKERDIFRTGELLGHDSELILYPGVPGISSERCKGQAIHRIFTLISCWPWKPLYPPVVIFLAPKHTVEMSNLSHRRQTLHCFSVQLANDHISEGPGISLYQNSQ